MIKILFAGDFIPPETDSNLYSEELQEVLKDKDFSLVNLETPLTNGNQPIEKLGNNFKRSPKAIKRIKDGFFDAVTLSNNHIRDYGDEGVLDTLKTCNKHNIQTVGAGKNINKARKPLRLNIKGKKLSILNYSEREFNIASENQAGANPYDTITAFYDIQKEKKENDYVIIVYHGGMEFIKFPTEEMIREFEYIIDLGADAMITHHSHVYSGITLYKDKPIFFGLGNFYMDYINLKKPPKNSEIGLISTLKIKENKIMFDYTPIYQNNNTKILSLLNKNQLNKFEESINNISNLIRNKYVLRGILNDLLKKEENNLISFFNSSTKFEYKVRKRFKIFNKKISKFKLITLLNYFRCSSHRYKNIIILKSLLNRKNN
ncbi:MAG: CapA family protein [bacterium]